jgi:hypothetical protein
MANYTAIAATTAAVTNRIVASTNMSLTTYTIANGGVPVWQGGAFITVTHTTVAGTDTLGTMTLVGTDINGQAQSETIIPVADSLVTSAKVYKSVTSLTSVGWVAVSTADTIIAGVAAGSICAVGSGTLKGIVVNTTAAATVVLSDAKRTIGTLKSSIAEGSYPYYDLEFAGFLKVATTSTNDITVIHTASMPSTIVST